MKRVRVLLADDHLMLLETLVKMLERDFEVVGVARDGNSLIEMTRNLQPDIIVMDISMPQLGGIDCARLLQKEAKPPKILFLSMYADLPLVEEAFRAGAAGYMLKTGGADELSKAIHCIANGSTYVSPMLADVVSTLITSVPKQRHHATMLTARQQEVLRLLAEGRTMREIGQVLNITVRTTESHKYEIMRNLGVKTTAELIRYALRSNIL